MKSGKPKFNIQPIDDNSASNKQTPPSNYLEDRARFLENENAALKKQLHDALNEINYLKQENMKLKQSGRPPTAKPVVPVAPVAQEKAFLSSESALPTVICDNCDKEIDKKNYDLHSIYCKKNITKCSFCKEKIDMKQLEEHISNLKGTETELIEAISNGDMKRLKSMVEHGVDIVNYRNENDSGNSLLHYAADNDQREMAEFLIYRGLNVNTPNKFGETGLHFSSKKGKSFHMARLLLHLGADAGLKNKLGDTPLSIAMRGGNQEAVMFLSKSAKPSSRGGASGSLGNSFAS